MEQSVAEHRFQHLIFFFLPRSIITSVIINANRSRPESPTPMNACSHKSISVCDRRTQSELESVCEKNKRTPCGGTVPPSGGEEEDRLEEEEGD